MASKKVRPQANTYLPPVVCHQRDLPRFSMKVLLLVVTLTALASFLGGVLWFHSDELLGEVVKDLKKTTASPGETALLLVVSSILPIALLATLAMKLPRDIFLLASAPIGLATLVLLVLAVRELSWALKNEQFAGRADSSLYLVLCMAVTFAVVSTALGVLGGIVLAVNRREDV